MNTVKNRTEESYSISKQFVEIMKERNLSTNYVADILLTKESEIQKLYYLPENKRINNEALYRIYFIADRVTDIVHCDTAKNLKKECIKEIEKRANIK